MRQIWSLFKGLDRSNRLAVAGLCSLSVVAGLLEAAVLVLVASMLLSITQDGDDGQVSVAGGAFEMPITQLLPLAIAMSVFVLLARAVVAWLTARVGAGRLSQLRRTVITRFSSATHCRQIAERQGSLQESAMSLATQSANATIQAAACVAAALSLLAMMAVSATIDLLGTLIVIAAGAAVVLMLRPLQVATERRARAFVRSNARFAELLTEWSEMAPELRVTGVESSQRDELLGRNEQTVRSFSGSRFATRLAVGLFKDIAVLSMVGFAAVVVLVPDLDLPVLGGVILIALRSLVYAQQANAARLLVIELSPNAEELERRLGDLAEHQEADGTREVGGFGLLRLKDVSYRYGPDEPNALTNVQLELRRGDIVGVLGPSGGGKSTLMQLLLRLRVPSEGTILVDDTNYCEITRSSWSELIGYVPQEPRLFAGTILENVRFFRPGVTADDAREAMRSAHIFEEVQQMPAGEDTLLGPRGVGVSGGQRQRLSIARALASKPQLLIMDEPTSALDRLSERRFQETISDLRGHVTMIVVAHRLATVESCDQLISIVGGVVQRTTDLESAIRIAGIE